MSASYFLISFSNSNSSNRAVFVFVQTPFDAAKQSILGRALPSLLVWDRKRTRFVECIHVALLAIFLTLFSNRNSFGQSASSCTRRCHSIREAIQHHVSHVFPAQPLLHAVDILLALG